MKLIVGARSWYSPNSREIQIALAQKCELDSSIVIPIELAVCHEIGHWRLGHYANIWDSFIRYQDEIAAWKWTSTRYLHWERDKEIVITCLKSYYQDDTWESPAKVLGYE